LEKDEDIVRPLVGNPNSFLVGNVTPLCFDHEIGIAEACMANLSLSLWFGSWLRFWRADGHAINVKISCGRLPDENVE
jgi:hypothetical protein